MDQTEYNILTTALSDWRTRGITPSVDEAGKLHLSPRRLLQAYEIPFIEANKTGIIPILNGAIPNEDPASGSCEEAPHTDSARAAGDVIKLGAIAEQLRPAGCPRRDLRSQRTCRRRPLATTPWTT